ncbi:hypothetical protein [Deinococcus misasensis]|uniref:hypothetical protein n=1 Tax=Deinococcus misasensis TaxID=392413 RepID=UPI000B2F329C|nr:hypothetical protein [Deinococcus misasensis]
MFDEHDLPDKQQILEYFKQGRQIMPGLMMGPVTDMIDQENTEVMALNGFYTDGVFVWCLDVPFHFRAHNTALPEILLNHIRSSQYKVPELDSAQLDLIEHQYREEINVILVHSKKHESPCQ